MAQHAATTAKPNNQPDMTVGEILRRTRIHYEQAVDDIERVLHIKAAQINAIEADDFKKLPGPVYAAGFIRSYSEYLGLDGDKMVSLFKSQSGSKPVKPDLHLPIVVNDARNANIGLIGVSVIVAVGILVLWSNISQDDRRIVDSVPHVPATIRAESAPAASPAQVTKTADASPAGPPQPAVTTNTTVAAAPAVQTDGIILKIVQNSWVEIKDSTGKAVVSRVLKAGDKYFVPARPDLTMSLGNSGGVRLEIDGKELQGLGTKGEVLRNIPLDIEILKKKFAKTIVNPVQ